MSAKSSTYKVTKLLSAQAQRLARLEHLLVGNSSGHRNVEVLDILMLMRGSRAFTAVHLFLQSPRKFCREQVARKVLTGTKGPFQTEWANQKLA
ncbi:MAG: hypothetical protein FRX49_03911 [Trebouxia sp. A1-2]|nr:MAG: hypothetical protein FRX49_03911 [Trebouxia sp. A1-2]